MFFECVQFGWLRNEEEEILVPVMAAEEVQVLPNEVSRVLACNCKAAEACKRGYCSCKSFTISCTQFCACYSTKCYNEWTVEQASFYDSQSDSEEEELV